MGMRLKPSTDTVLNQSINIYGGVTRGRDPDRLPTQNETNCPSFTHDKCNKQLAKKNKRIEKQYILWVTHSFQKGFAVQEL